jgi:DNA-binding response OmpR family regulator
MAVEVSLTGTDAAGRVGLALYDVVVLDRDLPGMHGDQVCRQIAQQLPETRVLMLTAASTVSDRVDGLELGADDYLAKPFEFAELLARVRALGRRPGAATPPDSSAVTSSSTRPAEWPSGGLDGSSSHPRSSRSWSA